MQTLPTTQLRKPPSNFVRCACEDLEIMGICKLYVQLDASHTQSSIKPLRASLQPESTTQAEV